MERTHVIVGLVRANVEMAIVVEHSRKLQFDRARDSVAIDLANALDPITPKITRLPPRDLDFRRRPIGNSGAFFGYASFIRTRVFPRTVLILMWATPALHLAFS